MFIWALDYCFETHSKNCEPISFKRRNINGAYSERIMTLNAANPSFESISLYKSGLNQLYRDFIVQLELGFSL